MIDKEKNIDVENKNIKKSCCNKGKKTKDAISTILVILVVLSFIIPGLNKNESIDYASDYYDAVNKEIIDANELEDDEMYWSYLFTEVQEKIDDNVDTIVKDVVSKKGTYEEGSIEDKICTLYDSVLNVKEDVKKLDTYLNRIDSSNSISSLFSNVSKINDELSLGLLFSTGIENDFKDNEKTMLVVAPFVFDFGNIYSDYYTNPLYASYASMYVKYDREILKLYGYTEDEAKEVVRNISKFYAKVAEESKTMEELTDVEKMYHVVDRNELNKIYSNIDLNLFMDKYAGDYNTICLMDEKQAKVYNDLLVNENLDTLKEIAKIQLLQNLAPYLDTRYYDLMNEMNAELTGTEVTTDTVEDYAIDVVSSYFDSEITQEYVKLHNKENEINEFKNIIMDIISEYKNKIKTNTWLSETTKNKALLKLDSMKVNVGYPEKWEDYSKDYKLNDSLFDNMISMNKVITEFTEDSVRNKENYWLMSALSVNAYYNAQENSINFPIALLEYDIYGEETSYYQKLGSFGMIIAHEITHAFDDTGALFDEKGNLNNWWQESDYEEFEKLQNEVIVYYDDYLVEGKKVNGTKTVGENIADLGAMSCIVDVAKNKGASDEELKEMFEAFANIWASKSTEEYIRLLINMDSHAPDKIRVNAVLSSIDEFYRLYNIKESDEMYKPEEERVKVW